MYMYNIYSEKRGTIDTVSSSDPTHKEKGSSTIVIMSKFGPKFGSLSLIMQLMFMCMALKNLPNIGKKINWLKFPMTLGIFPKAAI